MPHSVALPADLAILVVDDDRPSAKLIEAALADQPCRVVTAATAEEALRLLPELRPGVVLLDLELPGMNGLELARSLKSSPESRDSVIVLISSRTGADWRREATTIGCSACIRKPIDPTALPGLLLRLLKG